MMFSSESFDKLKRKTIIKKSNEVFGFESLFQLNQTQSQSQSQSQNNNDNDNNNKSILNECNLFIDDLYFITKPSDIDGMSSKISSLALNTIAKNEEYDSSLETSSLEILRLSLLEKLPIQLSTIEYLKILKEYNYSNQLLLVGKSKFKINEIENNNENIIQN